MRGQLGSEVMDQRCENHCEGERLEDHLQDASTVFTYVFFCGDMVEMSKLLEIVQVEESEEDAEPMMDFEIKGEEAERQEQEQAPQRQRLAPEQGGTGGYQRDKAEKTEKKLSDTDFLRADIAITRCIGVFGRHLIHMHVTLQNRKCFIRICSTG